MLNQFRFQYPDCILQIEGKMDLEKFVLCFYEMPFPTFFTLNPVVSPTWALLLFSNAAPSEHVALLLYYWPYEISNLVAISLYLASIATVRCSQLRS